MFVPTCAPSSNAVANVLTGIQCDSLRPQGTALYHPNPGSLHAAFHLIITLQHASHLTADFLNSSSSCRRAICSHSHQCAASRCVCVLPSDFFQLSRCLLHLCPKVSPLRAPALGWLERALDRRFRSWFCDRAGFIPNPCAAHHVLRLQLRSHIARTHCPTHTTASFLHHPTFHVVATAPSQLGSCASVHERVCHSECHAS